MSRRPTSLLCLIFLSACSPGGGTTTAAATETGTSSSTGAATTTGTTETPTSSGGSSSSGTTGEPEDIDMQPEDFVCLLDWEKVHRFRMTNLLGHMDQAVEVANSPTGGVYPVGTVIQLIPTEAMVKRATGFAPDNSDWEFFSLEVSDQGTTIMARGTTDVTNAFGGNCFGCHDMAETQWDRICEDGHGCDPLPITPADIDMYQMADPRCP